ncbi:phospholipid scramblase 2 isoform X1 [Aricia agestis]|uniref:phospholipid scramblase 2 isoform X1 n=2 Tax=Aricia agestis TaxID=91739 RepID=UPI001C205566|nr:phospholipid scramblase 2 isoform X1 [Aricia agestis]
MSHKPTPYSPNFPPSQGYAPPEDKETGKESYPMYPQTGYPGPPAGAPLPPGAQPLPGMQHGFQPGFQPGMQPGFQPGMQPGFQPGMQPGFQPGMQQGFQPGYQPGFQQGYPHPQPGYPAPVMQQPGPQVPGGWMTIPQGLSNCPPGLEYLSMIDKLLVHQKVELLEAFVGFETNNKYTVKNAIGQKVYYAVEDNDCCTRNCCGPMRPFDMKIMDNFQNEVIHLNRPLACDTCWCPCWLQSMEVSSPPGTVVGSVEQEWSICKPCYVIKNASGDVVLRIKGPVCTFSICGDVEFNVYSQDGETKVGKITKQWSGLAREAFTDADYFGISFPMDLDVRIKAVLLGACFLIDFMFFEKAGNNESDRPGML